MSFWLIQSLNSLALGGVLFTLAAGFSLIFGLMRVANLSHGAYFMLGAYVGLSVLDSGWGFGWAMLAGGSCVGCSVRSSSAGAAAAGRQQPGQVLATLGIAFIIADGSLWIWGGDPRPVSGPAFLQGGMSLLGLTSPPTAWRWWASASLLALLLWLLLDKTRLGVMIRASVDDMQMARAVGIPASRLFTIVFCLGAALAGVGGVIAAPDPVGLPGHGRRHAAARAGRGHPGRAREPGGRLRRQLPDRLHLQLRSGAGAQPRLHHPVPADGRDPRRRGRGACSEGSRHDADAGAGRWRCWPP